MKVYVVHAIKQAVYPKYDFEPDYSFRIIGVYKNKSHAESDARLYNGLVDEQELDES